MENIIEVKNYTKIFRNFKSVDNANFVVKKGFIHGFIGPNGAGKTTTIKAIIGAYIPTKGNIQIKGFNAGTPKANKSIGYIPERASFPSHLNAFQYLVKMAEISGFKKSIAKEKAYKILKKIGLEDQRKKKPNNFSSGMQKKILLAQALINEPEVLILDEPAANLDPNSRYDFFNELLELKNQGKTIFISSHILAELDRIIEDVTFISKGKILYSGKISELDNEKTNNAVINTSDNEKLIALLKEKNYIVQKEQNELLIENVNDQKIKEITILAINNDISIKSIRTKELQSIYNYFQKESNKIDTNQFAKKSLIIKKWWKKKEK